MKLDNKGFLITGILYSLLILFLVLIIGMLAILSARQNKLSYIENNIITKLNDKYDFNVAKVWNFDYTGAYQTFVAPTDGFYNIELWGASGGYTNEMYAGKGAYTKGIIYLEKGETVYIYVGQAGTSSASEDQSVTYNGGGASKHQEGYENNRYFATGGGATDIRLVSGTWNDFESLKSRIMVAGAGGGSYEDTSGNSAKAGYGGSYYGLDGMSNFSGTTYGSFGYGASQIAGGYSTCQTGESCISWVTTPGNYNYGGFGNGGSNANNTPSSGGGAGYYGGGASFNVQSAGGGSSFISGLYGCNAISSSSTQNNITHTNQSSHYSGKVFTNGVMIDGISSMPTHDGSSTMIGNLGNGYAKISLLTNTPIGYEITNLITNGNVENSTAGYTNISNSTIELSTDKKYIGSSSLKITPTVSTQNEAYISANQIGFISGNKYYCKAKYYSVDKSGEIYLISSNYQTNSIIWNTSIASQSKWTDLNLYVDPTTQPSDPNAYIRLDNNNQQANVDAYYDGIICINLTDTFGAGNEPDKLWCDTNISFFDGTTTIYK